MKPYSEFHRHRGCLNGVNTVCKSCRKPLSTKNYQQTSKSYRLWSSAKSRAKRKGLEFSISVEDVIIPDICPVFKIPMKRPTIDPFDNSKGYTKENIRVISYRANMIKSDASVADIKMVLNYMLGVCEL